MAELLVVVGLIAALWIGVVVAARRFEARRRHEGAWNDDGPIDPTFADPHPTLRAAGVHLPRIEHDAQPGDNQP
jgi:hypothetical protein